MSSSVPKRKCTLLLFGFGIWESRCLVFSSLPPPASSQPTALFESRCKICWSMAESIYTRAAPGRREAGSLDRKLRIHKILSDHK